jgi:dihydroflavonol-4-reductase
MRAIVTGGAGFIGSHLIEALVARGDQVTCLEQPGADDRFIRDLPVRRVETRLDAAEPLAAQVAGADVVFHLAGLTRARTPAGYYEVNTAGTARLADAIAAQPGPRPRLVFLSSIAATGPAGAGAPLDPDSVPCPLSHYGHSKLLAEQVLHARADRVPAVILRLPSVYGPRERGVLAFFRMVRRGVALTVGSWQRELSMLYVDDAVRGILAAAECPAAVGRTYCLAHPVPVSWSGFAGAVGAALGRRPRLLSLPPLAGRVLAAAAEAGARLRGTAAVLNMEKLREIVAASWVCDPGRARRELGVEAVVDVTHGAGLTAAWYRKAGWL